MTNKNLGLLLKMKNISKSFLGVKALYEASITIYRGEIHALVGENGAGKSTLMKILQGIYKKDSGSIIYKNKLVDFNTPHDALRDGISMIHQEISLIPYFNVAENIWLGRERKFEKFGLLRLKKRYERTKELLNELDIELNPKAEIEVLSIAQMQLVEITRAVSYNADLIIMDEPTSALSRNEIEHLFKIIKKLSYQGKTIIFISHKLEEIFEICSRMTIMRDGKTITTSLVDKLSINQVITMIAGREVKDLFPKTKPAIGKIVFECRNLKRGKVFKDISFYVRSGEILGVYGLMGAGRTEIMRVIFGIDKLEKGGIIINGKKVRINSPSDAIMKGLGMVSEDRLRLGIIQDLSVRNNLSISYLREISKMLGFINMKREKKDCLDLIRDLKIKIVNMDQEIDFLSGGNQQKVIFGRWLLTNLKILILDEPTRGIDVGAKAEVHRLIDNLAHQGIAIVMISSELPEVLGMSDRIIVIRSGMIISEMSQSEANQKIIMEKAFGA